MIVYENHFIILKINGRKWYYLVKKEEGKAGIYPTRHETDPNELVSYFKNYHKRIEPRMDDAI